MSSIILVDNKAVQNIVVVINYTIETWPVVSVHNYKPSLYNSCSNELKNFLKVYEISGN